MFPYQVKEIVAQYSNAVRLEGAIEDLLRCDRRQKLGELQQLFTELECANCPALVELRRRVDDVMLSDAKGQ